MGTSSKWFDFDSVKPVPGSQRLPKPATKPGQPPWSVGGNDPYLLWADASSFEAFGGVQAANASLPCLLELVFPRSSAPVAVARRRQEREESELDQWMKSVRERAAEGWWLDASYQQPATPGTPSAWTFRGQIQVPSSVVLGFRTVSGQASLRALLSTPRLRHPGVGVTIPPYQPPSPAIGRPGSLVIGIIDDGCPFGHLQFRSGLRSRVRRLWDQGFAPMSPWVGPTNFRYGRELGPQEIDQALADATVDGMLDEEQLYAKLMYPGRPAPGHVSGADTPVGAVPVPQYWHGASVMGLACGSPDPWGQGSGGEAAKADIIFVQLPRDTMADTSGGNLQGRVIDALRYIVQATHSQAKLVVNLSFGAAAGAHDGSSILERAIAQLLGERDDFAVVVPAGDLHDTRMAAELTLRPGETRALSFQVSSGNANDTFLELWPQVQSGQTSGVTVRVLPFGEPASPWLALDEACFYQPDIAVPPQCGALHLSEVPNGAGGSMMLVAVGPTDGRRAGQAKPGPWTVELSNDKAAPPVHIRAWIERSDPIFGSRGRQSLFSLNEQAVTPSCTLGSIANGADVVVVGGFVARAAPRVTDSSSAGPALPLSGRTSPDACAPSDESDVQRGLLLPGSMKQQWVRVGGTSLSAAIVTRRLANELAVQPRGLPAPQVRALVDRLGVQVPSPDARSGRRFVL